MLRTGLCTNAATYAYISVNFGYAFADLNGSVRTCFFAVAKADASVLAFAGASEEPLYCCAGLKSLIFHLCLSDVRDT